MKPTRITELFGINHSVIQAGMVWASGWKLASAVSNCGGLGLLGAGSMKPELLHEHIEKCKKATQNPFGVNIPLLRGDAEELVQVVIDSGVNIVFTSAGHPGKFIDQLKTNNVTVVHVVPSLKFARKAESAGCDAVVGEGVEAGGHNGADELTTLSLIPQLVDALSIPVIAAGGIADGRQIAAAMMLGAEGVQIGTLFAVARESSASPEYKRRVVEATDTGTVLAMRKIGLVRMLKNRFAEEVSAAEAAGSDAERLKVILGKKREQLGIFEGNWEEGALEAGQGCGLIKEVRGVNEIFEQLLAETETALARCR